MDKFNQIFIEGTAKVAADYMQLPVSGMENPIYRERVYCYELYHQLRSRWPPNCDYSLGGEVDKKSHPLIRGNNLDNVKPDLLVHRPGDMGGNYAVIEVKPVSASNAGLKKDLRTLTAFHRYGEYARTLLLVYGNAADIEPLLQRVQIMAHQDNGENIDVACVEIWWHRLAGQPVERVG
ncbi:hypothetical protein [Rhodoferax saidenbachensis]|uniref:Methionyl-tRNA formyltransferase-like protein n=1 Tax=Rhodoferax saidenbachensis TaxID=1484693 RepID=A0A1P8K7M1_9BURK|nr:hypothetical protein [Rhodoferax saidenbachensis]APW42008.1 hypothetical protein RS694_05290 [Rhodoferax saidenbachensis]